LVAKAEAVWNALLAHPRMPIADLAAAAYPGEEDAQHKVRAAIFALKSKGRLKNVGVGQWEAVSN
jgi:hypothetical protein